ncbi:MAG: cell division protein ZapA [Sneathiellales bacterium]|nr:cell division protein ZapA [Sneathiellales bacterium]
MASVTVKVNGRPYPIICGDGEEEHLKYLAEFVDKKVRELSDGVANATESQLLLMASLLIADDLSQAYETIENQKDGDDGTDAAKMEVWAEKLEAIALQMETA